MLEFNDKKNGQSSGLALAILVGLITLALLASMAWRAKADLIPITETILVQAAVAEADFNPTDRAIVWYVLKRRAQKQGTSLEFMAQAYVSLLKPKAPTSPRSLWILGIESSCSQPAHWPPNWTWSKPNCLQAFEDATSFLAGTLKDPCPNVTQWSGKDLPSDHTRATRAVKAGRWVPAKCASANQFFYERNIRAKVTP